MPMKIERPFFNGGIGNMPPFGFARAIIKLAEAANYPFENDSAEIDWRPLELEYAKRLSQVFTEAEKLYGRPIEGPHGQINVSAETAQENINALVNYFVAWAGDNLGTE